MMPNVCTAGAPYHSQPLRVWLLVTSRKQSTRSLKIQMLRQVRSAMRYSEFDWGGVAALPPTLQRLDLTHFNLAFQLNDRGDSCAAHSMLQKHKAMAHRRC